MIKVYACLLGNWVDLEKDPNCVMGSNMSRPSTWYKEGAELWAPDKKEIQNTYYQLDYIYIHYNNKDYRINPIFIQIVDE